MSDAGLSRREWLGGLGATAALLSLGGCDGRRTSHFAFITDLHAHESWGSADALAIVAERVNQARPEFIILGGDLVHGGFRSTAEAIEPRWKVAERLVHALKAPLFVAAGNHDLVGAQHPDASANLADPRQWFREKLNLKHTYQSYDAGGYHIVILDSVQPVAGNKWGYEGKILEAQRAWLRDDLAKVPATQPIVLVTHMPILTNYFLAAMDNRQPPAPSMFLTDGMEILSLFEKHNLKLVLQGHTHVNEMLTWRGVTFITGGSVCGHWWGGAHAGTPEGYGMIDEQPERIDWSYRPYGWKAQRDPNTKLAY